MDKYDDTLKSLATDIRAIATNFKYNISVQLLDTGLLLHKYISIRARKYGQSRSRLDTMYTLITHGGALKPSDLSKMTFRSKQNVTQIVDALERDGLVKRELVSKDRRTRRIIITRKGLQSIRESLPRTQEVTNAALPNLSREQIQELGTILRQIRKHLINQINDSASER